MLTLATLRLARALAGPSRSLAFLSTVGEHSAADFPPKEEEDGALSRAESHAEASASRPDGDEPPIKPKANKRSYKSAGRVPFRPPRRGPSQPWIPLNQTPKRSFVSACPTALPSARPSPSLCYERFTPVRKCTKIKMLTPPSSALSFITLATRPSSTLSLLSLADHREGAQLRRRTGVHAHRRPPLRGVWAALTPSTSLSFPSACGLSPSTVHSYLRYSRGFALLPKALVTLTRPARPIRLTAPLFPLGSARPLLPVRVCRVGAHCRAPEGYSPEPCDHLPQALHNLGGCGKNTECSCVRF